MFYLFELSLLDFAGNMGNFVPCCSLSEKFEDIISDKLFQLVHIPSDHLIPIVEDVKKEKSFHDTTLYQYSSFGKRERKTVFVL